MQTRLLACLVGELSRRRNCIPVRRRFGVESDRRVFLVARRSASLGGYMVSILFDVFATRPEEVVEIKRPEHPACVFPSPGQIERRCLRLHR